MAEWAIRLGLGWSVSHSLRAAAHQASRCQGGSHPKALFITRPTDFFPGSKGVLAGQSSQDT